MKSKLKPYLWVFIFLLPFTSLTAKSKPYDLVSCALFQNEEFFMKEWIEYHQLMGVQHFYLYDNSSSDRSLEILKPYIQAGIVYLFHKSFFTTN